MLNWIGLYATNMVLTNVKEETSPYTLQMKDFGEQALLPSAGLDKLLGGNKYITIAIPMAILIAVLILGIVLSTVFASYTGTFGIIRDAEADAETYGMARTAFASQAWRSRPIPQRPPGLRVNPPKLQMARTNPII